MPDSPNKYYTLVGRIATSFAGTEMHVVDYCGELLGINDELSLIIFSGMRFQELLNIFSKIFKYQIKNKEAQIKLEKILNGILEQNKKRNTYVHSVTAYASRREVFLLSPKAEPGYQRRKIKKIKINELKTLLRDIQKSQKELYAFVPTIINEMKGNNLGKKE